LVLVLAGAAGVEVAPLQPMIAATIALTAKGATWSRRIWFLPAGRARLREE
jgi:hypothetical protein